MQVERLQSTCGEVIEGPLLITPQVFDDDRGFFYESWNQRRFDEALGTPISFVQDNHSRSRRGVLRGLHYQLDPEPQGKLVRCIVGAILDVAVDLRRSSPTFGMWVAAELSADNHQQFWVPVGFAHGFLTLSKHAEVLYKASGFWNRTGERSLRWNDPDLDQLPEYEPRLRLWVSQQGLHSNCGISWRSERRAQGRVRGGGRVILKRIGRSENTNIGFNQTPATQKRRSPRSRRDQALPSRMTNPRDCIK